MERITRGERWLGLLLCVVASCTEPGPRLEGRGAYRWAGDPPTWGSGPCIYEVHTSWSTSRPHVLRIGSDESDWSVVVSASRAFSPGRHELRPAGEGEIGGRVMHGATVAGAVLGSLELRRSADSTFVAISGAKARRDTVALDARCRLGPLSEADSSPSSSTRP